MSPLEQAVIEAYRSAVRDRYDPAFIRTLPELEQYATQLSDEMIARVRDFFLDHLYPEPTGRTELDAAFDRMKDVMTSPRKLWALVGTAGRSLFKLGGMIPSAISAGLKTLEAVQDIRKLESQLVALAEQQGLSMEAVRDRAKFRRLAAAVPEKQIRRFTTEMNRLFEHLANVKLLETTIEILEDSRSRMEERPDLFTPEELAGQEHGLRILHGGLELYRALDETQVRALQAGVTAIELGWHAAVVAEQAARSGSTSPAG